jgi:hypothetical protein
MDLNKLTLGDRVVAISAILLLIFAFFPWFNYSIAGFDVGDENGYDFFLFGTIPVILGILMVVQIALTRFSQTKMPAVGSLTWGQVHVIAGGLALLLVLIKLLIGSSVDIPLTDDDFDGDRAFGIFLALISAAGLTAGGFLKMREGDTVAGPPPVA